MFIGIMNTSGLLQSKWSPKALTLTLQETRSIEGLHLLCKRPEVFMIPWTFQNFELIVYIYILL